MSEKSASDNMNVIHLDDRLRDVEKSLSALAKQVEYLAEIAAASQSQMASQSEKMTEQSIIQTEILSTVKRSIDQVNELRVENDILAAKVYDLELWRGKFESHRDVIRKSIAPIIAIIIGVAIAVITNALLK